MKKSKSYFGNRFKSAVRGFRAQRNAKKELAANVAITSSEFEVLEPRVLLSGVGKASTSKSWVDADGDKVVAKIVGKGAGIQVDVGDGKFIDAANINIVGADYGALSVVVSPVGKMTTPVTTKVFWNPAFDADGITTLDLGKADNLGQKIQGQWYNLTPGYTNIGSITAEDSKAFGLTAPNAISSINLSAVVVPSIDLGDAVVGNINLSTGRVAMVDSIMANNKGTNSGGFAWIPGLGGIDFFNIKAGSIDQINLAGIDGANNDFVGTIELTTGGLNRLTGTNSDFNGDIYFSGKTGSLGSVFVQNWGDDASINALGDLTFLANDFDGVITVGGHLNVQFRGGFYGVIVADGGVSGLRASTTDTIIIQDDFGGQLVSKGDIADIIFEDGGLEDGTIEGKNIGTVRFDEGTLGDNSSLIASGEIKSLVLRNGDLWLGNGDLLVSAAKVGSIDVANGDIRGEMAAGSIGAVTLRGGDLLATLVATTGDIGAVNIELGNLAGGVIAQKGNIGDVTVLSNDGGPGISGDIIAGTGKIGTINASNVGGGEAIGGDAVIFAKTDITAINASTTGDTAIGAATITAQGTLGPVNAIAYGAGGNGAIDGLTLVAPTIGAITATSVNGIAIANSNFTATTGAVANISGTGKTGGLYNVTVTAATSIGNISGQATVEGSGIQGSTFSALGGTIGTITGTSAGPDGNDYGISDTTISATGDIGKVTGTAFGGTGIDNTNITSLKGNIGDVVGSSLLVGGNGEGIDGSFIQAIAGSIGNVTGTAAGNGNGIDDTRIEALTGIGTLTGSSITNDGIDDTSVLVSGPGANIAAIVASTVSGIAINDSNFTAIGGTIGSISATPTGVGGRAIDNSDFTAATLGDLTVTITNLAGGYAINRSDFVATQGNIGKINVTNNSLANGAFGIQDSEFRSNKGNIGDVTVSTAGNYSDAIRANYGNVTDFIAAGNIGKVTLTTSGNYSDGIDGHVHFFADNDNSKAGDIGDVSITVSGAGSNGIIGNSNGGNFPHFESQNIGNVSVNVTNLGGYDGIVVLNGQETVFDIVANMGTFTVNNAGTAPFANGLENVKLDVGGTLGAVSITTVGGVGMVNSSIDPTTIASVTITSDDGDATNGNEVAMDNNSEIVATVSIGNVTITGDVQGDIIVADATPGDKTATTIGTVAITGDFSGDLSAGTTIGAVTVSGDASGNIYSGNTQGSNGDIGTITVGTANGLDVRAGKYNGDPTLNSTGNVGNIVITGNDNNDNAQSVFVAANASADLKVGGKVGTITATGITDAGETLEVGSILFTTTQSVGVITVENKQATESANLNISLGNTATVVGIGNISVDGDLQFNNNNGVKTMGTIGANAIVGGATIGAGGAGTSIGLISLATGSGGATTFNFLTMNGVTTPGSATLAVSFADATADITTAQASLGVGNTSGGVTMNMI